jgi:putative ABC transport system substrate-binding protein
MLRSVAVLLLLCLAASAARPQALPRIGVLSFTQLTEPAKQGLRGALREEGYVEGRNILIEWRAAEGRTERAKAHAQELVRLKVDLIVAMLTPAVQAASEATKSIPIVMAPSGAPQRFVASLARPGGNVTGMGGYGADLSGKRIELVQELLPGVRRIGLLTNTSDPFAQGFIAESQAAARKAGVELHLVDVTRPDQIDAAYAAMKKEHVEAVIVQGVLTGPDWQAAQLALRHRLPAVSFTRPWTESGGLMYHAGSSAETSRRVASFVKRILEGARPAELPVERPTRTELVINLKTAKALDLTVPRSLLLRADQVIE